MASISIQGPQFGGHSDSELRKWAVGTRLPWLVERLGLTAGAICDSVPEPVRRKVLGLGVGEPLPTAIDWSRNGIVISPPGTGKGMAIFVEALAHYERVFVLVPSVIQAHKLEASLDALYAQRVGGCFTSQRKSPGLIRVITTGIFHQLVIDPKSDLWKSGSVLCVDEAQRILEQDPETEFAISYAAHRGVPVQIVSATIAPGRLPTVFGHTEEEPALVYELNRQMHPVDIRVLIPDQGKELEVLAQLGALKESGSTSLIFAPSRRQVMSVAKVLRKEREEGRLDCWAVPVTGAHVVEDQLEQIERAQRKGKPVVVIATPGTMDSSVTIPGLTTVVIIDRRIRVDWNQYGVRERWSETLPMNHIWQMVRRVGRQARADGGRDKVFIQSPLSRSDVLAENPTFDPIEGCSPHTPLEGLLLEAVMLNVPFGHVAKYMVSTFPRERVEKAVANLVEAGIIRHAECASDHDGFEATTKGQLIAKLPFEFRWNRLIVEASEELRPWLLLAASFGRLDDLEAFEQDEEDEEAVKHVSEIIHKLELGRQYLAESHDHRQYELARTLDLSFRRLEQVETLYTLGCEALDLPLELPQPSGDVMLKLLETLVTGGLRVGLFKLFFPGKGKEGWSDPRETPDEQIRRFFLNHRRLALEEYAQGGICAVVATETWFTTARGMAAGNLDDVTIVPRQLVASLVKEQAAREGWFKLEFDESERYGTIELCAHQGGIKYVPSRLDAQPETGRAYWCSVDRRLARGVVSVLVHYPVLEE